MLPIIPNYISILFVLTTFLELGFFYYAIKISKQHTHLAGKVILGVFGWMALQAILALSLFYANTSLPPRIFLFGALPTFILMVILFNTIKGKAFIDDLSLATLTYLNVIRIPVEIVLYWLFLVGAIPELMTFAGRNFDIIAGITAPFIAFFAIQRKKIGRTITLSWNILMTLLLLNIVVNAILSGPFEFQQFAFDQPNLAILYFPMIWLPTVVVPIVFFAHFVSIRRLLK